MTPASDAKKADRLSLAHWHAVLEAAVADAAAAGLPSPAVEYLKASLLHGDATQWQAYGNGWSLRTGDDWRKRAKEFLPDARDRAFRGTETVDTARLLAQIEARAQGAPLPLPGARDLLGSWVNDYSRFGLLSASRELGNEIVGALEAWMSAALGRKPLPSPSELQTLVEISTAHARWLASNPLTAMCFPFGSIVQVLGKAEDSVPADVIEALAVSLEKLVSMESSERRRRDQWVAKLRDLARRERGGAG